MNSSSKTPTRPLEVAVLGDGSFGTALSIRLAENGHNVRLWSAFAEMSEKLRADRENKRYLPGVKFPSGIAAVADPIQATRGVDLAVSVVPTQHLRSVAERFENALPETVSLVSATKGLEIETFQRPSEILLEVLGQRSIGVLTGPSHAEEVALGKPSSVVAASEDEQLAELVQQAFNSKAFRVYTSTDRKGAELAGALKNVIALAAGISDGLELGDNAKAALLTRGMVELARYGAHAGARPETFFGLAGFGDLVTTCCSAHSRNRSVGERLGRGQTLAQILDEMDMVAEGVWTTQALFGPESEARGFSMPIAEQVNAILFEGRDPREAVTHLMQREAASELEGFGAAFGGLG